MRTLFTVLALCLSFWMTARATELSLPAHPTPTATPSASRPDKIHMDLSVTEESDQSLFAVPVPAVPTPTATVAPEPPVTTAPLVVGPAAGSGEGWVQKGTGQNLTLDPPKQARPMDALADNLPRNVARYSGLSDSTVYGGLGVLLLALGWACAGNLSRRSAPPILKDENREVRRVVRTKMLPLKPKR